VFDCRKDGDDWVLESGGRRLRLRFVTPSIVRVTYSEGRPFLDRISRIVISDKGTIAAEMSPKGDTYLIFTTELRIRVDVHSGALSYFDAADELLVREPRRGGKWLTEKDVYRNTFASDEQIAYAHTADGVRAEVRSCETIVDRRAFEAKLEFAFGEHEALFGLGSHEEGIGNLRGHARELYQHNLKAVVPLVVSTRGYGILLDCCSLMTFHDDEAGSYWWADVVDELDYYVIRGRNFEDVTRGYYDLTGRPPMLPKWAFGYVQSKERYVTADEMLEVVREYRRRRIPLDLIVLDWKSWPNGGGWGQKSFDPERFSDPAYFVEKLHAMGAKLMVSIWPMMTGGCPDQRELLEKGLMLGDQATYDAFSRQARECYWEQARRGLFIYGIDSWWCDCTEPFEADWGGKVKPEPHRRLEADTGRSKLFLDAGEINAYSLLHSQGIYEGQRSTTDERRVLNLTRSAYAGQHRYGTVTWNGDTCATWETLRRCIPEGVNFCAAGEPYWTVDTGGFFIDWQPEFWFWRGGYSDGCRGLTEMNALQPDPSDSGCTDPGFWELYTRWMQYAAFLPMMRSHGTDAAREIWRFGDEGSPFYDAIADAIRLRYRLLPYIYSVAAAVTQRGSAILRAVALEFPSDPRTYEIEDQYFFGASLMICPVVRPMYFDAGSTPLRDQTRCRDVYLPQGADWFDFVSGRLYAGGKVITADAPLDRIPVFVRAGSIVPMTQAMQFVDEVVDAPYSICVYRGADTTFILYEDAGDGYAYERGEFVEIELLWSEDAGELFIASRRGVFPTMVVERDLTIEIFDIHGSESHRVRYAGKELRIRSTRSGR
jgi:alpha-D-xyloside xylohydrolase